MRNCVKIKKEKLYGKLNNEKKIFLWAATYHGVNEFQKSLFVYKLGAQQSTEARHSDRDTKKTGQNY